MKRLPLMTILLGALVLLFALPFVFLSGGLLLSMIGSSGDHNGVFAIAGGFGFGITRTRIVIWIFILAMAIFAFGVAPKLFRRNN